MAPDPAVSNVFLKIHRETDSDSLRARGGGPRAPAIASLLWQQRIHFEGALVRAGGRVGRAGGVTVKRDQKSGVRARQWPQQTAQATLVMSDGQSFVRAVNRLAN